MEKGTGHERMGRDGTGRDKTGKGKKRQYGTGRDKTGKGKRGARHDLRQDCFIQVDLLLYHHYSSIFREKPPVRPSSLN